MNVSVITAAWTSEKDYMYGALVTKHVKFNENENIFGLDFHWDKKLGEETTRDEYYGELFLLTIAKIKMLSTQAL